MPIKYRLVSNDIDIDMGYTINSRISSKDRPNLTIRAGTIALFSGVMLAHKFVENFIDSVCGTAVRNTLSEIHVFMDINIPMERFFAYCRKKQHKGYLKPEGVFGGGAFGGDTSANNSGSGTIYIGRKGDISIRIYDKNAELSKKGMESMQKKEAYINRYGAIPDPWTRIEIRIKRRYLRENGAGIGPIDTVWDWQLHKGMLIEYIMTHTFRFVESDFKTTMPEWRWSMDKFVQYSNDDNASRDIHALQAMSAVWRNDIGKNMNIKSIAAQAIGSLQSVLIKCLDMPGNSHNDLLAGLKYILAEYFPIGSPSFKRLTFKGERKTNVKNANFSTENIQQIAQQPRKPNNAL